MSQRKMKSMIKTIQWRGAFIWYNRFGLWGLMGKSRGSRCFSTNALRPVYCYVFCTVASLSVCCTSQQRCNCCRIRLFGWVCWFILHVNIKQSFIKQYNTVVNVINSFKNDHIILIKVIENNIEFHSDKNYINIRNNLLTSSLLFIYDIVSLGSFHQRF